MKKMKLIGSIFLSLVLILSILPIDSMTVYADNSISAVNTANNSESSGTNSNNDGSIINPAQGYNLTLNPNYSGATIGMYDNVTTIELPSLKRAGYDFLGWAETANGDLVYEVGYSITLTADKTLFALWKYTGNCTIVFWANGGEGTMDAVTKPLDKSYVIPDCDFTRSDYVFMGWSITKSGSVKYSAGDTVTMTGDMDLYAVWGQKLQTLMDDISPSDGGYVYLSGIRWRVIGENNDRMLLISADSLSGSKDWNAANDYCSTVYEGFSTSEKAAVLEVTYKDKAYDVYAAADLSNAKLFLLSASEAIGYFSSSADRQPDTWLRSKHYTEPILAGYVKSDGDIDYRDIYGWSGTRPAFVLNLSSVLFSSAAEGGKSSAATGSGEFGNFSEVSDSGRKFTLLDSSRTGFGANVGGANSATVAPGGTLALSYSGASTNTDEYVSAMICNSDGDILYYASLTPDASGSGTWNMTIPDVIAGGNYTLKVFSEQQNGNTLTDYASTPVEIGLTVSSAALETVATPTFTPASGTYDSAQNVTLSCTTEGADIHYTTDGTTPNVSSSKYTGLIFVSETTTIKAIAIKEGMSDSDVVSATYTFRTATTVTKVPTAKSLVYNGSTQELVTAGSATGGTMHYAVTTENTAPADNHYTTSIPTATNAGTYYVWYKVVGNENYTDYNADTPIEVVIAKSDNIPKKLPDKMSVSQSVDKIEQGILDAFVGWKWAEGEIGKEIPEGGSVSANATYGGLDKDNYNITEATVEVSRANHDHTGGKATCHEQAVCEICGQPYGGLDATNHSGGTEIRDSKDVSCTEDGYTGDTYCLGCDTMIQKGTLIPAEGHVPAEAVKENEVTATCTTAGSYEEVVKCSVCGEEISRKTVTVPATGHDWGDWKVVKPATETEEGVEERVCKKDSSHKETRSISKLEPKPATETQDNPPAGNDTTPAAKGVTLEDASTKALYTVISDTGEEPAVEYKASESITDKKVIIPDSVTINGVTYKITKIADNAFAKNKKIEKVVLSSNIKSIGNGAFSGCTRLKSVTIPANVIEISDKAFKGCTSLTGIKIGNGVTKIGASAFEGCKKLKTIIVKTTKLKSKTVAKNAFKGVGKKVTIKVPKKMKKTYTKLFRKKGLSKKVKIK